MSDQKFSPGHWYITGNIADWCSERLIRNLGLTKSMTRHTNCDWGDLDAEDKKANNDALKHGGRLFSAYIVDGRKIWIITEADRSATTILFPEDY